MDTNPSTGPAAHTPRIDADEAARLLPQLNQRLLQLTAQLNEIHAEVDKLAASLDDDSAQIAALVSTSHRHTEHRLAAASPGRVHRRNEFRA